MARFSLTLIGLIGFLIILFPNNNTLSFSIFSSTIEIPTVFVVLLYLFVGFILGILLLLPKLKAQKNKTADVVEYNNKLLDNERKTIEQQEALELGINLETENEK